MHDMASYQCEEIDFWMGINARERQECLREWVMSKGTWRNKPIVSKLIL